MWSHRKSSRSRFAAVTPRRGAFMVIAVLCLVLTVGFVAFSVDIGMISLTRAKMQSACDAAALAGAMEITHAVETAPANETNITGYAKTAAAAKAAQVAQLNGYYVNPSTDVVFGSRTFNPANGTFTTNWSIGASDPTNVLKVTCRKENSDLTKPDAKLRLLFAGIFGSSSTSLRTEATAYVEARDIVVVHDFSRSMNFDSYFSDEYDNGQVLSDAQLLANLQLVYEDLQPMNLGNMGFTPQWLTVSRTNPNLSVQFRLSSAYVTSEHTLKSVKLYYTDNTNQTLTASGTTGTFTGTGSNASKNLSYVQVTASVPTDVPQSASVTQSGSPNVTAVFSADRLSVAVSASSSWNAYTLKFTDGSTQQVSVNASSGTYSGTSGNAGKTISAVRVKYGSTWRNYINAPAVTYQTVYNDTVYQFDDTDANVMTCFGLNGVTCPSGTWSSYISFVRTSAALNAKGYREKYGGLTFTQYLMRSRCSNAQTPPLAFTRHYPFHAIKTGHSLLCNFLGNLGFNDHLGMVSYDTYGRIETSQSGTGIPTVDITAAPLGTNYTAINNLMAYKQAGHYYSSTNIGGGMRKAIELLNTYGRSGARPNIILMTDGNANVTDGPTTLPSGWESWFNGFNGEGSTYDINFDSPTSSQLNARYSLFYEVNEAVKKGYVVHTIAVGGDADWVTMKAIAHYGKGEHLYIPGGQTPASDC